MSSPRDRAIVALHRHAPELEPVTLIELGHGLDNTALRAGELVLRVGDVPDVVHQAGLLDVVAAHLSLPVPLTRFADAEHQVLAYSLLPGTPLLGRQPPPHAAQHLGRFLRELHSIDPGEVAGLVPLEEADPREWLADLDGPAEHLDLLRSDVPTPGRQRVLAHADLGAEHILEHEGALTGIIDWSDAAVTDPALDFARLYRDFGPEFLDEALTAYGGLGDPAALERITFFARCAALEDLAYGRESGRSEYETSAVRSLDWLF